MIPFRVSRYVRLVSAAGAAAVMALGLTGGVPAAADSGQGVLAVAGTANLPTFPCRANPCGTLGSFNSIAAVGVATAGGIGTGALIAQPGLPPSNVSSSFQYTELCENIPGVPVSAPPTGTAAGTITATTSSGAQGAEFFYWERVGLTAILLLDDSPYNTGSPTANLHATGVSVAVFAPEGVPGPCDVGGINAVVAGVGIWT